MKPDAYNGDLRKLLQAQFLLLSFINTKLEIFNYIAEGYEQNRPVLRNNRFFIYVAHILQKSLIIDFAALFDTSPTQKNNFHKLYSSKELYKEQFSAEAIEEVRNLLSKYTPSRKPVKAILYLRNTQIAHYDPKGQDDEQKLSIQLNWDYRLEMNDLYNVGKHVIQICSNELGLGYDFPNYERLKSLNRMVEALAKTGLV